MRKTKKMVTTTFITALLAGLLGFGSYGFNVNWDWTEPTQAPPISDAANYPSRTDLQLPTFLTVPTRDQEYGTCVSVHDGDTIIVRLTNSPGQLTKVRLIGIDTPELKAGEFGETAGDFTRSLLLGQGVELVYDRERYDKYGRTLAYVYLMDGTFVNSRLVEEGYARVMIVPPNTTHAAEFNKLQGKAQEKQIGIWAQPPPTCTWRN